MTKPAKTISFDKKDYFFLSAEKGNQLAFDLAVSINQKISEGKIKKPEIIIGIARGALAWIKTLSDWLNIGEIATIQLVHYAGIGKRLAQPTILHSCLPRVDKKRVLLFDNVVETGETMEMATEYLSMCGAEEIITASLYYKETSKIIPSLYSSTINAHTWIFFYFDMVESIKLLGSRWLTQGLSLEQIHRQFLEIGLPERETITAMKILFNYSS